MEMRSVLAYYAPNINVKKHSMKYLLMLFEKYQNRACENLGVSNNKNKTEQINKNNNSPNYPKHLLTDKNSIKLLENRFK